MGPIRNKNFISTCPYSFLFGPFSNDHLPLTLGKVILYFDHLLLTIGKVILYLHTAAETTVRIPSDDSHIKGEIGMLLAC